MGPEGTAPSSINAEYGPFSDLFLIVGHCLKKKKKKRNWKNVHSIKCCETVWVGEGSVFNKGNIHCIPFQGLPWDRKEAGSWSFALGSSFATKQYYFKWKSKEIKGNCVTLEAKEVSLPLPRSKPGITQGVRVLSATLALWGSLLCPIHRRCQTILFQLLTG